MGGETHDDDAPECAVGVTIAAAVEPMTTVVIEIVDPRRTPDEGRQIPW